jgi:hypothetical protein
MSHKRATKQNLYFHVLDIDTLYFNEFYKKTAILVDGSL